MMAFSLLIHALLGCCCHHAHDAAGSCEPPVALAVESGCCQHDHGDCGNHRDKQHGQPSHDPCKGHSTCHGICTFLPVQKSQLSSLHLLAPIDFAAIGPAVCETQVGALNRIERVHDHAAKPPLRLHLLHQILLI